MKSNPLNMHDIRAYLIVITTLATFFYTSIASGHNVVSGAYTDGMIIEGEIGFSNGDMAEAGSPVKIFDEAGNLIAELQLTEGGVFRYEATTLMQHVIEVDLSAGHVAKMVIEADELIDTIKLTGMPVLNTPQSDLATANTETVTDNSSESQKTIGVMHNSFISAEQLQSIVRSAVAQQIRPLQKELRAYKEKVMFRDITGGLGFIFGLFGVAAWLASKRDRK